MGNDLFHAACVVNTWTLIKQAKKQKKEKKSRKKKHIREEVEQSDGLRKTISANLIDMDWFYINFLSALELRIDSN